MSLHAVALRWQDNAPEHNTGSLKIWFVKIGVEVVKWTEQSPDHNPIERLWGEWNARTLTNTLVAEWAQIPTATFQKLVESIPRVVEAVIVARNYTRKGVIFAPVVNAFLAMFHFIFFTSGIPILEFSY